MSKKKPAAKAKTKKAVRKKTAKVKSRRAKWKQIAVRVELHDRIGKIRAGYEKIETRSVSLNEVVARGAALSEQDLQNRKVLMAR